MAYFLYYLAIGCFIVLLTVFNTTADQYTYQIKKSLPITLIFGILFWPIFLGYIFFVFVRSVFNLFKEKK